MSSHNKVLLAGDPVQQEAPASGAVTPGMLLEHSGADVQAHSTADGPHDGIVAIEEEFTGDGIDTDYTSGDRVVYIAPYQGCILNMILADGETIAVGDKVASDGNGHLQEITPSATTVVGSVVGTALEAVTTSGSTARLKIRWGS